MRTKGGCRLSEPEWRLLQSTEVGAEGLSQTSFWYEAAYEWSIVTMPTVVRWHLSATQHKTPFVCRTGSGPVRQLLGYRAHAG